MNSSGPRAKYSDLVYDHIKRLVLNGRLLPGERILEDEIAAALHVSKTPVREALNKLGSDCLVESKGRNGTYVAKMPDGEVVALYEARLIVEPPLARWAAEKAKPAQILLLEQCLESQRRAFREADNETFLEQDRCFHEQIACVADNPIMLEVRRGISNRIALLQALSFLSRQRNTSTAVSEHEKVLQAIKHHDGPKAAEMMYAHIDNVLREKKLALERRAEKFGL